MTFFMIGSAVLLRLINTKKVIMAVMMRKRRRMTKARMTHVTIMVVEGRGSLTDRREGGREGGSK